MVGTVSLTEGGLKKQIARLRGFANYDGLRDELLRVLWSRAESDEHAERIITEIVDSRTSNENGFTACPAPAELIAIARTIPTSKPTGMRSPRRNCSECGGSGFARDYVLATRRGDRFDTEIVSEAQYEELRRKPLSQSDQAVYVGVHLCHCRSPRSEGSN
jgi:hypothetical protein